MKKKKNAADKIYISRKTNKTNMSAITQKSELATERSRSHLKSKSPLGERDSNQGKAPLAARESNLGGRESNLGGRESNLGKKAACKSPLQVQKSLSYLRRPQAAYSSTCLQQTLTRKSLNSRK